MAHAQHLALRQIPPARRAYNPDRSRVLGWYVARHDEDRYDETTEYRIGLFDAATEEELTFFVIMVRERADTGATEGQHLRSAAFDPADDGFILLRFADDSEQRRAVDEAYEALRAPPSADVVMDDEEKEDRARLLKEAERLRKRKK